MDTNCLNDMNPIPPKDLPSKLRNAFKEREHQGYAYYKSEPCHVCGKPGHPTSKYNRLYVLMLKGRRKQQASYERWKSIGVRI
eukprot:6191466-Pleurochrysis_carterae.AAC.2